MTPESKALTALGNRMTATSTPEAINYGFLHRGTLVVATMKGVVMRVELYQKRALEALSGRN
jgi:hypothetical protein